MADDGRLPPRGGDRKPHGNTTHGHSAGDKRSPEYRAWQNMLTRCHNPKGSSFKYYGERGITVCKEWRDSFEAFLRAVGPRPGPGYSLERVKNEIGYQDGNVVWATKIEQANNKRSNRMMTHAGRTMTLAEWARDLGIDRQTLKVRLKAGWSVEETLSLPASKTRRVFRKDD